MAIRGLTGWRCAAGGARSPPAHPTLLAVGVLHSHCRCAAPAGVYIADALSMPVHWYYDVRALQRDFGRITKYEAPKEKHPGGSPRCLVPAAAWATAMTAACSQRRCRARRPAGRGLPQQGSGLGCLHVCCCCPRRQHHEREQHRGSRAWRAGRPHRGRRHQPRQARPLGQAGAWAAAGQAPLGLCGRGLAVGRKPAGTARWAAWQRPQDRCAANPGRQPSTGPPRCCACPLPTPLSLARS